MKMLALINIFFLYKYLMNLKGIYDLSPSAEAEDRGFK
jgi:hypothetical protein